MHFAFEGFNYVLFFSAEDVLNRADVSLVRDLSRISVNEKFLGKLRPDTANPEASTDFRANARALMFFFAGTIRKNTF